jgi:hypothetical protein
MLYIHSPGEMKKPVCLINDPVKPAERRKVEQSIPSDSFRSRPSSPVMMMMMEKCTYPNAGSE